MSESQTTPTLDELRRRIREERALRASGYLTALHDRYLEETGRPPDPALLVSLERQAIERFSVDAARSRSRK